MDSIERITIRKKFGMAFQEGALFDSMNVYENIRLGITNEDQYRDKEFCDARVAEVLKQVNLLPDVAKKLPSALKPYHAEPHSSHSLIAQRNLVR